MTTTENQFYRAVERRVIQQGCGRSFYENRCFIESVYENKLVRDVGNAKYAKEKAASLAEKMNANIAPEKALRLLAMREVAHA